MTNAQGPRTPQRPLLVNGEALKLDVTAPRSGGGDKFHPQTFEQAQEVLGPQIDQVVRSVQTLPQELRARDRLYVEAKLLPNYLAASYFPDGLLSQVDATPVGSRADVGEYRTNSTSKPSQTRRLILSITDDGLDRLRALIVQGGRNRSEILACEDIRKFEEISLPREVDILKEPGVGEAPEPLPARAVWEAVLNPLGSRFGEAVPLDEDTVQRWIQLIHQEGGVVYEEYIRRVGGLTFMPVGLPDGHKQALARFNPLRVLRRMPAIRPRPRFGLRGQTKLSSSASARPVSSDFSVAVFDGGVDKVPAGSSLFSIPTPDLTPEPAQPDLLEHGTGVTGAVLYGLVGPGDQAPTPPLPVESYRVLPTPVSANDLDGYWVLDRIKETVEQKGHRLVNLSLGPTLAVEDDMEPNRWTSELDQLAWEKDVLFVVAAGNDGEADQAAGLHRVQVPGDMANGLTVGACDAPVPIKNWSRAPYSSMGPGRHGLRIQPMGVQFGGGDNKLFDVLCTDGSFLEARGTSFAAPVTTHALADLATRLPRVNSSVLRAFAAHFAERPKNHVKLRDEVGYGRQPLNYQEALDCSPNEVHVLYVDEIERQNLLAYQVPIVTPVSSTVRVKITLAYASPVDPTQPTEYTRAALDLNFRPHHRMYRISPPKGIQGTASSIDASSEEARELLTEGWTLSQEPVTKNPTPAKPYATEADLRDSGKWETVRHGVVSLKPGEVEQPRLELSYMARRGGGSDASPSKVPFALLVSVIGGKDETDLYDRVRAQYQRLSPAQRTQSRLGTRGAATSRWF